MEKEIDHLDGDEPVTNQIAKSLAILLRPASPDDHPFVVDSWVQSYRNQTIARDAGPSYMHDMKWIVRAWMADAAVLVACDPEEPGAIWGWAATNQNTILYCYVRQEFRRHGIARQLLAPYVDAEGPVLFAAKSSHPVKLPRHWRYSFLAALRLLRKE